MRDSFKPEKPELDLQVHEEVVVDDAYVRKLISYHVEADQRAYAYLGMPLEQGGASPTILALQGADPQGMSRDAARNLIPAGRGTRPE